MTDIKPKQKSSEKDRYMGIACRALLIKEETPKNAEELTQQLKDSLLYYQERRKHYQSLVAYCNDIIEFLLPLVKEDKLWDKLNVEND